MLELVGVRLSDDILDGYLTEFPIRPAAAIGCRRDRVPLHRLHPRAVHAVGHGPGYGHRARPGCAGQRRNGSIGGVTVLDPGILLVSATRSEARYVPDDARLLITGIGKVAAAVAVTRELAAGAPTRRIVNIGTAGALHDHHAGLFLPSTVIEHDISSEALQAMGYPVVDSWNLDGGDGTVLATGDTFVAEPVHRQALAVRADLVDMEGCAVAHVGAAFEIPVTLVKVVSDSADEKALDWPQLVDRAARDLGDWVRAELS